MTAEEKCSRVMPIFLVGSAAKLAKDKARQNARANKLLKRLGVNTEKILLVVDEEELEQVRAERADCFVVFPFCADRFSSLIHVADSNVPMIIVGEASMFADALNTYEYLLDHANVEIAFSIEEVRKKVKVLEAAKWVKTAKICVFGVEKEESVGLAWSKNPVASGNLNIFDVKKKELFEAYHNADRAQAVKLARKWMKECEVKEPSLEDVAKSASVYLAMKRIVDNMAADAAYVYLCGNFTKGLGTKMCFAVAKLADDGIPVGCWRGENLLPMLILRAASKKPVFVCEADRNEGNVLALKHCFAPSVIAGCKYVLRRWRDMKGTVTGYCQLPRGEVTLVNCGIGDKMAVDTANVLDCKDMGNETCRMTILAKLGSEASIRKLVGREFAMVYGNYRDEVKAIGTALKLEVL